MFGDIQNPAKQYAEQSAAADPALSGAWTRQSPEAPSYLSYSVILL